MTLNETRTTPSDQEVQHAPRRRWRPSTPVALATLVLAVTANVIACAALILQQHHSPGFTGDQISESRKHLCDAYVTVRQGIVANTHLRNPNPQDATAQLTVFANARLALLGGGAYLQQRVAAEPAAPGDLAQALREFSSTVGRLGVNYLAGVDNSRQEPLRRDVDEEIKRANELCK
jgi:hypothetical protein